MQETSQTFIKPCVEKNYIYAANFHNNLGNCFFRIHCKTFQVKLLSLLSGKKGKISKGHRAVFEYGGRCFIFSFHNYDVVSYDLLTGEESYYSPDGKEYWFDYIQSIIQIEDKIWILQDTFNPQIMVFSLETNTYEIKNVDLPQIEQRDSIIMWGYDTVYLVGREIRKAVLGTNQVIGINIDSLKAHIYRIPINEGLVDFVFYDRKGHFLTDKMNLVVASEEFKILDAIQPPSCVTEMDYDNLAFYKNKIIYIPCLVDKLIYTDICMDKNCFHEIKLPADFGRKQDGSELMYEYSIIDDHLLLFPIGGNGLVDVDLQTMEAKNHIIALPKDELMLLEIKSHNVLSEGTYSLAQFLDRVKDGESALQEENYSHK